MKLTITKDKERLAELEGVIQRNLQSFYEVGRALMEIRDNRLYQHKNGGGYQTFEEYCRGVWDFNSSRARQLIAATETVEAVKTVTIVTPANEGQARPLMKLPAEKQKEAWRQAVETAPEGKVTAAHVQKVVREMVTTSPRACSVNGSSPLAHLFVPEEHHSFLSDLCAPYRPLQNSPFALCSRNRKTYLLRGCDVLQEGPSTSKDHIREADSR